MSAILASGPDDHQHHPRLVPAVGSQDARLL